MFDREPITPKTLKSHSTTMITTTTFRIFLIFPSIGMYVLISHNATPTIIRAMRMDINDIFHVLLDKSEIPVYSVMRSNCNAIAGYRNIPGKCV